MPKPPSPVGAPGGTKHLAEVPEGQNCAPGQPWAAALAVPPLSWEVLTGFSHHLPSSLSSPWPETSPGRQDVLCWPCSCREVLSRALDPVHTGAGINPWGKAVAVMGGEPG